MPPSRRTPESAGEPAASLEALCDALRTRGWIARVITWPREPACVVVQNPHDGAVSGRVLAVRDTLTGAWWYWFGRAEPLAPAGRPAAAAEAAGQILAGGTRWPGGPGDPGDLSWHGQPVAPGVPGLPTAEMGTPGQVLAELRAALAARGVSIDGMTISRLHGVLTPASGPPVRYACGWLAWSAGRLSHRGRPLYAVHSADDPAGAARRLVGSSPFPARPDAGPGLLMPGGNSWQR
jgi:hypothetical protein